MKSGKFWAWLTFILGAAYFFIPLIATLEFSMRMKRGEYSFEAYRVVLGDARFQESFTFSVVAAIFTIILGVLLVVPTAYWIRLRLPQLRPIVEFVTLLPLVIPAMILPSLPGSPPVSVSLDAVETIWKAARRRGPRRMLPAEGKAISAWTVAVLCPNPRLPGRSLPRRMRLPQDRRWIFLGWKVASSSACGPGLSRRSRCPAAARYGASAVSRSPAGSAMPTAGTRASCASPARARSAP